MSDWDYEIDRNAIDDEFCRAPAMVAYLGEQYAKARMERDSRKIERDQAKAQAHVRLKTELADAKPKPTVGDLEAMVSLQSDVREAEAELLMAEHRFLTVQGQLKAAEAKKDMLQSLGAHLRAEMQYTDSMKRQQPNDIPYPYNDFE